MSQNPAAYNKSGMMIFLISMVTSLLFFVYIAFIHPGVTGIDEIKEIDETAEGANKEAAVEEINPDDIDQPWVSTPEMVAAGAKSFALVCASCHGKTGLADGIAATPQTRNLVEGQWTQGEGTAEHLYKIIQNGIPGTTMVSFKAALSPNKRWAVVHFIRSITKNKKDDDAAQLETFAKTAD